MEGLVLYQGRMDRRGHLSNLETLLLRAYLQVDAIPVTWALPLFSGPYVRLGAVVRNWLLGRIPPESDMRIMLPDMRVRESLSHAFAMLGTASFPNYPGPTTGYTAEHVLLALRSRSTADGGLVERDEAGSQIGISHPDWLPLRLTLSFGGLGGFAAEETPPRRPSRGYRNMRLV